MAEPARVLRAAEDGRTFGDTVISFRAKAERLKSKMGDKAKRAIVDKFFLRFPELGVTDAAPYVAESGTPLCVAEQEEKQYREGTVILEITKRDAA